MPTCLRLPVFILVLSFIAHQGFGQWVDPGNDNTGDIYYNNGKVGIGTSSPSAFLDVRSSGSVGIPTLAVNNTWSNYSSLPDYNRPFIIRRNAGDNESIATYVQDNRVHHYYRNDESSSSMEFRFNNTDTENGVGQNASNNVVLYMYSDMGGARVGINTTNVPAGYHFSVDGKAIMEEVQVASSGNWPDYVFTDTYKLNSLSEVSSFISENGHLPNIPTAKEVKENGIKLGEMNAKLLEKVEELTLYLIEKDREINDLKERMSKLENQ